MDQLHFEERLFYYGSTPRAISAVCQFGFDVNNFDLLNELSYGFSLHSEFSYADSTTTSIFENVRQILRVRVMIQKDTPKNGILKFTDVCHLPENLVIYKQRNGLTIK